MTSSFYKDQNLLRRRLENRYLFCGSKIFRPSLINFGFNSESSASKNYSLFGNTVYINNKDIEAHYNKQKKHKIEFILKMDQKLYMKIKDM